MMKKLLFLLLIFMNACSDNDSKKESEAVIKAVPDTEKLMHESITLFPDSMILKENLIQYYRDSGYFTKALEQTGQFLITDSMNPRLWEIKAILFFENADTLKAIHAFENAVSIFPAPQYLISLGTLYAQKKNSRALNIAAALVDGHKNKFKKESLFIKGLYYSYSSDKMNALAAFDACISLNYTFMDAYREKAIVLYDMKKYNEALSVLDKAITLQNNFEEGYYYSGRCLEKMNRIPEAIQSYKNALVFDPDYLEAKGALTRLGVKG